MFQYICRLFGHEWDGCERLGLLYVDDGADDDDDNNNNNIKATIEGS